MVAGEGAGRRQRHGAKPRLGLSFALLPAGASPLRLWGGLADYRADGGRQPVLGRGGQRKLHGHGRGQPAVRSAPHARPALPPHAASLTPLGAADDMVNLGDLHEAALLHNLRIRFFADDIFTHIGPILVACNPYKRLPIFTPAVINVRAARRSSARAFG